jgi:AraC-like DNA-binding protein
VAHALLANLADNRRIEAWAAWAGASPRTLSRHFITETGLAFGQWRQHARITKALEMLQLDQPITSIALELGYETTSAFISMFKRTWGVTPGKYGSAT